MVVLGGVHIRMKGARRGPVYARRARTRRPICEPGVRRACYETLSGVGYIP